MIVGLGNELPPSICDTTYFAGSGGCGMLKPYGYHFVSLAFASVLAWAVPIVVTSAQNNGSANQSLLLFRWIELTADGKREERSIYSAQISSCPNGTTERLPPYWASGDFEIRVCSRTLEGALPSINKIAIIGDTGCRLLKRQNCRDENSWPLKKIAGLAAEKRPDLVIHVGDYLYRECPGGELMCADPNEGNRWNAWLIDFFQEAQDLLGAAPWIFVRGNHESCGRQAEGWARLLSPRAERSSDCKEATAPYLLKLGGINLVVVDSSAAGNSNPLEGQENKLSDLLSSVDKPLWLLSHKPLHNLTKPLFDKIKLNLVLSGHVHGFTTYSLGPVTQFIVGNGGTKLAFGKHGYLLMARDNESWLSTLYGTDDTVIENCVTRASTTECKAP
jgi:predicted phosphodiesterase